MGLTLFASFHALNTNLNYVLCLVTKPLGGAAEFVAQTGQGLLVGSGWTKDHKQRYPAACDHVCTFISGSLKYSWKIIAGSNLHDTTVLSMLDVTTSSSAPATLVLTSEALFVVSGEEDAQEAVHAISDVDCVECQDDPTKINIVVVRPRQELTGKVPFLYGVGAAAAGSVQQPDRSVDRVAEFVIDTGIHCTVSDLESDTEESEAAASRKTKSKKKSEAAKKDKSAAALDGEKEADSSAFYASPVMRSAFAAMFQIARRQAARKGFDLL